MKLKPFDLEAAKAGAQVVTRDGTPVRMLCFDRKATYPLVGLIQIGSDEALLHNYSDGKFWKKDFHKWDLFMAPVKRTVYINVYTWCGRIHSETCITEQDAQQSGDILRDSSNTTIHHIAMPVEIEE